MSITTEYSTLKSPTQAQAFDAIFAKVGEHTARFGQKPTSLDIDRADVQIADLYVQSEMKKNGYVTVGVAALTLDPKQFSASMASLATYMDTNKIAKITVAKPESLGRLQPPGSLFAAAIEAALSGR